jgi:type II secretory pathway pseudopilin PulG
MALVAVLGCLVAGAAAGSIAAAKKRRARAELASIGAALESYRLQQGDYPRTAGAAAMLQALLGRCDPAGAPIEAVPSLFLATMAVGEGRDAYRDPTAWLADPWGRPYCYAWRTAPDAWSNPRFVLYSLGPDGVPAAPLTPAGFVDADAAAHSDDLFPEGGEP